MKFLILITLLTVSICATSCHATGYFHPGNPHGGAGQQSGVIKLILIDSDSMGGYGQGMQYAQGCKYNQICVVF